MGQTPVYANKRIQISTAHRKLYFIVGNRSPVVFPIAVGKPQTPTPAGIYHVINKIVNPGGMLGTRWLGLDIPDGPYGIHGTFQPDSIGKFISNGCIRMYNRDVEELFPQVQVGITVMIDSAPAGGQTKSAVYVVKEGDILGQIARRFGVSVNALASRNNLDNPDFLQAGQVLWIPAV